MPDVARTHQELAEQHLPLVKSIALKLVPLLRGSLELDDLIAYGTQGMLEAAERYDPARGLAFSTFAFYRIRGAMIDGLRESGALPRAELRRARAVQRMDDYLENQAERAAGATGPARLDRPGPGEALALLADHVASLTTIFVTSLEGSGAGEVEDESAQRPFEETDARRLGPRVHQALSTLAPDERALVERCYLEERSLKEAGDELGFSRSWASRLHARAIQKLRLALEVPSG